MLLDFKRCRVLAALLLGAGATCAWAQAYSFTTLAGDAGYLSRDGVGGDARFSGPSALVVDASGNLYVSDSGNHTIRRITPAGAVTTFAGRAGYAVSEDGTGNLTAVDGTGIYARFAGPGALAMDAAGNLLVSDGTGGIRKVTPSGVVTTLPASVAGGSMAMDRAGNLFVVVGGNLGAGAIRKIAPDGTVTTVAGTDGSFVSQGPNGWPVFSGPNTLAVDGSGRLIFAELSGEHINYLSRGWHVENRGSVVRRVEADGTIVVIAGSPDGVGSADGIGPAARFQNLTGLVVDPVGNIFVSDQGNSSIRKISPGGAVSTLAGVAGATGFADGPGPAARFFRPAGLALDSAGNLLVAEAYYNTIRKITPGGVVTTLAGNPAYVAGPTNLYVDGPGSTARFNTPGGVAVDRAGNVFIADGANSAIRKISPAGLVTTLAITQAESGGSGNTPGLGSARGIAIDGSGVLFVSDLWMVRKITPAGVMTTLAGALGGSSVDGPGNNVDLGSPAGVAVDRSGNVFLADSRGSIRKITAGGVVTVLAGVASGGDNRGSADAVGPGARFNFPFALTVDGAGNVFVADTGNYTIRKITPGGVVTTIAGAVGISGAVDGTGGAAQFTQPTGIAVDGAGNLFVADVTTVRKITPGGVVTTIAGKAGNRDHADGTGSTARFGSASAVAVDGSGNLFVTDTGFKTIRKGVPLANPARLINVSVLASFATGGDTVTVGTIIGGAGTSGTKPLLVRAVGPSLSPFGVTGMLADPRLEFFTGTTKIDENDDWAGAANLSAVFAQFGAFPFAAQTSKDAALIIPSVAAGNNTLRLTGTGGGTVLAELYDATPTAALAPATPRLINVSVLMNVGSGLTAGFIVVGDGTKTALIRAVGPSLAGFGVSGPLADPKVELFDGQSRSIATNDNWGDAGVLAVAELNGAFAQAGAFVLGGTTSKDAALLITLAPGNHTVQVRSADGTSGVALVEIYEVP